jgi:hypothetical protein
LVQEKIKFLSLNFCFEGIAVDYFVENRKACGEPKCGASGVHGTSRYPLLAMACAVFFMRSILLFNKLTLVS